MHESEGQLRRTCELEKIFRVYATGNREPWLVLGQEICVYLPQVGRNGV